MRRLITSISMIVLAIVFYQCSSKSGKVSVDTNQQDTLQSLTQVYHPLSPNLTVTVLSSLFLCVLCPTNFILFEW